MNPDDQRDEWRRQLIVLAALAAGVDLDLLMEIHRAAKATAECMNDAQKAGVDITPITSRICDLSAELARDKLAAAGDNLQELLGDLESTFGEGENEGEDHG